MSAASPLRRFPSSPSARTTAEVRAIEEAAAWYVRLSSGSATDDDQRGWENWRAEQPHNRFAWERVEAMHRRISLVPGTLAAPALTAAVQSEMSTRRTMLRSAVGGLGITALAWWGWQQPSRREWMASLRTNIGEQRDVKLSDGSQLVLNTGTSVDTVFTNSERRLVLLAGEILVQTTPDPEAMTLGGARPFLVETAHGRIRALGTRFLVRTNADESRVTVLEKAVEVRTITENASGVPVVLHAGQQLRFTRDGFGTGVAPADPVADAWQQGSIIANDMPLGQLLTELGRYRPGMLGCDPGIASLLVSGVFPVPDTDRALSVLATGLKLRVETRTRYWVRVMPGG
ncbi:FecR domain-containing protein [Ottowia thiooxydans]|uniref:FecR domain-containing protein n=1 Tax=Ottowia thiooxydans TaxID=219182 RepID=UPI0004234B2C|nr:FecR domain-containing protein [Ottowia thiooxydans]